MPRRSSTDLHIVPLPGKSRPAPPSKLSASEQQAWRAIVDAAPGGFINGAGQIILRRAVAEIVVAERHEERLRRIAEGGGDLEAELELSKAHQNVSKSIVALMTALRATPRARMESKTALRSFSRAPSGRRPWDIIEAEAKDDDDTSGSSN
jgi:hypothetical protein